MLHLDCLKLLGPVPEFRLLLLDLSPFPHLAFQCVYVCVRPDMHLPDSEKLEVHGQGVDEDLEPGPSCGVIVKSWALMLRIARASKPEQFSSQTSQG